MHLPNHFQLLFSLYLTVQFHLNHHEMVPVARRPRTGHGCVSFLSARASPMQARVGSREDLEAADSAREEAPAARGLFHPEGNRATVAHVNRIGGEDHFPVGRAVQRQGLA